ncbi:MAG: hypothetical protein H6Q44_1267, partial [Deltaproteobacteria bacterium]|nr:hypothetical protein [Deltaproteobacteria bacterium]
MMYRRLFAGFVSFFFLAGCAAMEPIEVREKTYGTAPPVISQSFASKEARPGDTWKVYLKAEDPNGDMKRIFCTIDQPGMGTYPVSDMRIKEADRKELSGFIYLNIPGRRDLDFVSLTLTLQIQDMAGHLSQPAVFPLALNPRATRESPPPGTFPEKELGPVMIQLRTPFEDG